MKSVGFVAAVLCLLAGPAFSVHEDCPEEQVCPLNIQVRSDASNGVCDNDFAGTIRSEIVSEVGNILTANPTVLNALRSKYLGLNPDVRAATCADIYRSNPAAENGYYYLENQEDRSFCRFDFATPGDFDEFGWERLTLTDMREVNATCPGGLVVGMSNNVRYCIKQNDFGCYSIFYGPRADSVKRIYGRIYGIQSGTPDVREQDSVNVDDNYVDGVSLTYGSGPRNHIWTFYGYTSAAFNDCPCDTNPNRSTPSFVDMDYFCESGTSNQIADQVYVDDPIWDAQNCELTQVNCCNTGPWFYREFESTFTDSIELRLCTDQDKGDEDIGLQLIELWIQ